MQEFSYRLHASTAALCFNTTLQCSKMLLAQWKTSDIEITRLDKFIAQKYIKSLIYVYTETFGNTILSTIYSVGLYYAALSSFKRSMAVVFSSCACTASLWFSFTSTFLQWRLSRGSCYIRALTTLRNYADLMSQWPSVTFASTQPPAHFRTEKAGNPQRASATCKSSNIRAYAIRRDFEQLVLQTSGCQDNAEGLLKKSVFGRVLISANPSLTNFVRPIKSAENRSFIFVEALYVVLKDARHRRKIVILAI